MDANAVIIKSSRSIKQSERKKKKKSYTEYNNNRLLAVYLALATVWHRVQQHCLGRVMCFASLVHLPYCSINICFFDESLHTPEKKNRRTEDIISQFLKGVGDDTGAMSRA